MKNLLFTLWSLINVRLLFLGIVLISCRENTHDYHLTKSESKSKIKAQTIEISKNKLSTYFDAFNSNKSISLSGDFNFSKHPNHIALYTEVDDDVYQFVVKGNELETYENVEKVLYSKKTLIIRDKEKGDVAFVADNLKNGIELINNVELKTIKPSSIMYSRNKKLLSDLDYFESYLNSGLAIGWNPHANVSPDQKKILQQIDQLNHQISSNVRRCDSGGRRAKSCGVGNKYGECDVSCEEDTFACCKHATPFRFATCECIDVDYED